MKVFHSFRLDVRNQCLWRDDQRVPLPPKAFEVLRYLVEHPGRLVTQDEILQALRPEVFVNPEVVKKYILGIRKVLGESDQLPLPEYEIAESGAWKFRWRFGLVSVPNDFELADTTARKESKCGGSRNQKVKTKDGSQKSRRARDPRSRLQHLL